MAKRKQIDWEAIEREYRLGQLTLRELSVKFGPSFGTIGKRARKEGWVQDKTEEVRRRTKAILATENDTPQDTPEDTDTKKGHKKDTEPTQNDIEAAAMARVKIVRGHRKTLSTGHTTVNILQSQLNYALENRDEIEADIIKDTEPPEGANSATIRSENARRKAMLKAVSLPSHAGVMRDLSVAMKNLIPLERQAFNLDDESEPDTGAKEFTPKETKALKAGCKAIAEAMKNG